MKFYSGMLCLLIIILLTACNKDDRCDLYVKVLSSPGQVVEGAYVYTDPPTEDGITDEFGTILLTGLEKRTYEVYAYLGNVGGGKTAIHLINASLQEVDVVLVPGDDSGLAPIINVLSPSAPAEFSAGDTIVFSAKVEDNATLNMDLKVTWESSLDGVLNTDAPDINGDISFSTHTLSSGIHEVTLTVEDTDGYRSVAAFELSTVAPNPVTLLSPNKDLGKVQLEWTRYEEDDFFKYDIYRAVGDCGSENFELIATIFDQNVVSHTDQLTSIAYQACYFVRLATTDNGKRNSNKALVEFPSGHIFNFIPYDVFKHPTESMLYLLDRGAQELVMYNYASDKIVRKITLSGTIGYGDIGENGYGVEVYLPSDDGRVYVYEANGLSLVTTINTGLSVSSVAINGLGHVIANTDAENHWYHPLRVYSRSDGGQINSGGDHAFARLKKVPGHNRIISISMGISPVDMDYYEISDFGFIDVHYNDDYHGDYDLSPHIFRISDNGVYTVSSKKGIVYLANNSMQYRGQLYNGPLEYSDFAFSEDGSIIYAATSNEKSIQIGDYYTLLVNDEIPTRGYPQFLIRDGNKLIALSKPTFGDEEASVAVEIIDL